MTSPTSLVQTQNLRMTDQGYFEQFQPRRGYLEDRTKPTPRLYEFINAEDEDGPRRAKSHAVKDSRRRQKVAGLNRLRELRGTGKHNNIAAAPVPAIKRTADNQIEGATPSLARLDSGVLDQYSVLRDKLVRDKDMGLVHSYHTRFIPNSFQNAKTDYQCWRDLTLDVAIQDAPTFYMVVSGSAEAIAVTTQKAISHRAIFYRGKAMGLINDRMKTPEGAISNGAISSCTVLAGLELLFGTPAMYQIHMEGLCQMVKLRGGFDVILKSDPRLAALIAWHDFSGHGNLAGRRYFEEASRPLHESFTHTTQPLRFTFPTSCRGTFPRNYILYDDLFIILEELESATLLQHLPTEKRRRAYATFVDGLNEDLIRTLNPPSPSHTTSSRRYLMEDSYRLAALIYISALCEKSCNRDWKSLCEDFVDDLTMVFLDQASDWGYPIKMILQRLMNGGRVRSQENIYFVLQIMDLSIPKDWYAWEQIRDALFKYFTSAKICAGTHQDFWICTLDIL